MATQNFQIKTTGLYENQHYGKELPLRIVFLNETSRLAKKCNPRYSY